jgi:hypothetical protein
MSINLPKGNRTEFELFCQSLSILSDDLFEEYENADTERATEIALARIDVLETVIDELEYYIHFNKNKSSKKST